MKNSHLLTLLLLCLLQSSSSPVFAEETNKESEVKAETEAEKSEESRTVLQGGVRGSVVRLEEGLVMVESSSKMVQGSALEIAKEVTRKETAVVRGPNYIGNGIVIPAIGNPNGTMQLGEAPARKEKVDRFLVTAEEALKALKTQVDGLIIPEGAPEDLHNLWSGMQSTMKVAETNVAAMRELANLQPPKREEIPRKDAKQIGRAALKVYDSMTALDKMRTQILAILEPKTKTKE